MTDILILGATGLTGRLITEYLCSHPERLANNLSLVIGGRNLDKLTSLLNDLPDSTNVTALQFKSLSDLELKDTRLVINTIGPYFLYTPTLAHLCAQSSTHYLDLAGEPHQLFNLVHKYDTHSVAQSTRSLIIPACGYDSIPSDLTSFLSAKALFDAGHVPGNSTTAHSLKGSISGGTIATAISTTTIPKNLIEISTLPFASSPIVGPLPHPKPKSTYSLSVPGLSNPIKGSFFPMSVPNIPVVQRSYGLLEFAHLQNPKSSDFHYGPKFTYDEFLKHPNSFISFIYSYVVFSFMACLEFKPISKLVAFLIPPGSGPSKPDSEKRHFKATNFTFAASSSTYAKTVFKGAGEPGYYLTSIMISESALSILIPSDGTTQSRINPALPPLAHSGGLLTPSTGLGDVLAQRLVKTGKFTIETELVDVD